MGARNIKEPRALYQALGSFLGSGGRIRTGDLRVMSPTSCHCSTPRRRERHRPIVPGRTPVSSALGRFTTVFGMGTGGSTPLTAPPPEGLPGLCASTEL